MKAQGTLYPRALACIRHTVALSCAIVGLALPATSNAQDAWPSKPIRLLRP